MNLASVYFFSFISKNELFLITFLLKITSLYLFFQLKSHHFFEEGSIGYENPIYLFILFYTFIYFSLENTSIYVKNMFFIVNYIKVF